MLIIISFTFIVNLSAEDLLDMAQEDYSIEEGLSLISKWEKLDNTELYRGIVYHNLASMKLKEDWIEKSITLLSNEYNRSKKAIALGYWGSILTVKADYQINKNDIIGSVTSLEKGSFLIDDSIKQDPNNINNRFLRLLNGVQVSESSPFDRGKAIEEDISFLENFKDLNDQQKSTLCYYAGRYYLFKDNIDKGLRYLEDSIKAAPYSNYANLSRDLLLEWEE